MQKRKIIIDCDPGIDDALALMLACASDELEILGVTITAGNIENEQGAQNALDILHLMNRDDIPVYLGASRPLVKEPVFAKETHGSNGIGETILESSPNKVQGEAVEFMNKALLENDDVSVIALGPLTNIAELIKRHPESVEKISELVLMGGNFKSHGNCSPVAEFNFWFDPDAAKIVFDQLSKPITMTGLDVTRKALLTPNYQQLIKNYKTDVTEAIAQMTKFYTDFHWDQERVLGCVINDPLAVAQFIDSSICSGTDGYVEIITEGPAIGMSMVDEFGITGKEVNAKILTEVDHKKFFRLLFNTLFPDHKSENEMVLGETTYGE